MRSIATLILLLGWSVLAQGQLTEAEDGKYYNHRGELYTGTYIEYYPSGSIHIEMAVLNGEKHGSTSIYFENGQKQELRHFDRNLMHGTWVTWDEAGRKRAEAGYEKGQKHGAWSIWDENGVQRYEMHYQNGAKAGTWIIRNEAGETVNEKTYE